MGAIFAVMKLNSRPCGVHYRERASAHPQCSLAKRDLEGPEGWVSLVGGVEGTYRMKSGCGGRGLLKGSKKEGGHKHSANDLKHTNNTAEINVTAQMKTFTPGANGRMFGREETASFLCIIIKGSSLCVFKYTARL